MKKRIITLLAVLALLVTCAVIAVQAEGETTPTYIDLTTFQCPCSACTEARATDPTYVLPRTSWTEYTEGLNVSATVDGGHYYYDEDLGPGTNITVSGKEVVFVLDNMTMTVGGSRAMTIGGAAGSKVHIIGNSATLQSKSTATSTEGVIAQIYSGGELHLYGGITIQKGNNSNVAPKAGIFRMPTGSSLVYLHASTGMNLPATAGDPIIYGADLAQSDSTIDNNLGGIAYLANSAATFTMEAGTLYGAKADRGGALSNNGGTITITGGTVYGGYASNRGGAIFNGSGTLNIGGTAKIYGYTGTETGTLYRGVCVGGGTCNLYGNAEIISSNKSQGDGVMVTSGVLTLDGAATVKNSAGTATNNIWLWAQNATAGYKGEVRIDKDWTGTASVYMNLNTTVSHGGFFGRGELVWGVLNDSTHAWTANAENFATGVRSGLRVENADHDYPSLYFFAYTDGGTFMSGMVVSRVQLIEGNAKTWYLTPSASVLERCAESETDGAYIKLWANYTLPVGANEVTVDLNGINVTKAVTLEEGGKLYVFDSKATGEEAGATIASTNVEPITVAPNGKVYATVAGDSTAAVYEIGVSAKVDTVNFRPSTAGIYYGATATFTGADEAVAVAEANLSTGVAVSVEEIVNFADTAWTAKTGKTGFGILVDKILKDEADWDNAKYADQMIYAEACVTYGGKLVYMSDDGVGMSLTKVMEKVAEQAANEATAKEFYAKWAQGEGLTTATAIDAWATNEKLAALAAAAQ